MKYRTHQQLICSILDFCQKPQLKTHIMGRCILSYDQLRSYLPKLVNQEFLSVNSEKKYVITTKGVEYLTHHKKMSSMEVGN